MIKPDGTFVHQPLAGRVRFFRPNEAEKRGHIIYTDTELAMAIQKVDAQEEVQSFSYASLAPGSTVAVEGREYVVERIELGLLNISILVNHSSYPLSFDGDVADFNAGSVFDVNVYLK